MLFAFAAVCLLLVTVGAEEEGCLSHYPLYRTYLQFNRRMNTNLDWDVTLANEACLMLKGEDLGFTPEFTLKLQRDYKSKNVPHVRKVNNILMGFRNEAQRNLISNLPPHTKVGCDSFYKGTVMTVACLYEKRLD